MEAVNGVAEGPPPPSPLTGCYLLVVLGEPHTGSHKDIILQRLAKGLLSWNVNDCLVDLEKELTIVTEQGLEGEEARYGERLIQFASENLVTEILIHPSVSTLVQCVRNLLSSFTRHRHIIHAGYTFAANGSWILQDGTFSVADFSEAFQEIDVQRVIRAYENGISFDIHCSAEGEWMRLPKDSFTKGCKLRINPDDVLDSGSPAIANFVNYISPFLVPAELENTLESSDVVGNIRFSRPTLYVFPGGQGDAALFGINGFNMLVDGGFSRKACFWDFVRHLDRLDAVMLTRLNNSNANGIGAVLRRKAQNAVYPQIGHFFCNIQNRKVNLSPDGDKDKDPLVVNLLEEGQELISNLRSLELNPQLCYRDTEPINLYHKVGHGTLDMYVINPAKDSREVKEFLLRWNSNDQRLFANHKFSRDCLLPLQNIVSICALLIWRPANPNDTITRILFPGSAPQNKIFEGLDRLKNLECIKHTVCTEKTLAPPPKLKSKENILDKIVPPEKPKTEIKRNKPKQPTENKLIEDNLKNGLQNGYADKVVKKSGSIESDKSDSKPPRPKKEENKIVESNKQDKEKSQKSKPETNGIKMRSKAPEKKPSPPTPKKTADSKKPELDKETTNQRMRNKISPSATPAKSTKDATNRRVLESKSRTAPKRDTKESKQTEKKEEPKKVERKPISRRPKAEMKMPQSPVKRAINGSHKPDSLSRKTKLDRDVTTDSSTVSTPSVDQDNLLKKDLSKMTPEEMQQLKAQELAELKEEQEAIKELEAVFRKSDKIQGDSSDLRKVKDISIDDKTDTEEYLIVEKEIIEPTQPEESETDIKEEETVKLARDSEESEKKKDESETNDLDKDRQVDTEQEESGIGEQETDLEEGEEIQENQTSKEPSVQSPDDNKKILSKDEEVKEQAVESQPDEKVSANIESGATTTAPTLPEDERIPLNEIKEDIVDQIEEKHVKEETKEKETKEEIPVITFTTKTAENVNKLPSVVGIRLDKETRIRDIVKTPDEVADLPVHEEVDADHLTEYSHERVKSKEELQSDSQSKDDELTSPKKSEDIAKENELITESKEKEEEIEKSPLQEEVDVHVEKTAKPEATAKVDDEEIQGKLDADIHEKDSDEKERVKKPDEKDEKESEQNEVETKVDQVEAELRGEEVVHEEKDDEEKKPEPKIKEEPLSQEIDKEKDVEKEKIENDIKGEVIESEPSKQENDLKDQKDSMEKLSRVASPIESKIVETTSADRKESAAQEDIDEKLRTPSPSKSKVESDEEKENEEKSDELKPETSLEETDKKDEPEGKISKTASPVESQGVDEKLESTSPLSSGVDSEEKKQRVEKLGDIASEFSEHNTAHEKKDDPVEKLSREIPPIESDKIESIITERKGSIANGKDVKKISPIKSDEEKDDKEYKTEQEAVQEGKGFVEKIESETLDGTKRGHSATSQSEAEQKKNEEEPKIDKIESPEHKSVHEEKDDKSSPKTTPIESDAERKSSISQEKHENLSPRESTVQSDEIKEIKDEEYKLDDSKIEPSKQEAHHEDEDIQKLLKTSSPIDSRTVDASVTERRKSIAEKDENEKVLTTSPSKSEEGKRDASNIPEALENDDRETLIESKISPQDMLKQDLSSTIQDEQLPKSKAETLSENSAENKEKSQEIDDLREKKDEEVKDPKRKSETEEKELEKIRSEVIETSDVEVDISKEKSSEIPATDTKVEIHKSDIESAKIEKSRSPSPTKISDIRKTSSSLIEEEEMTKLDQLPKKETHGDIHADKKLSTEPHEKQDEPTVSEKHLSDIQPAEENKAKSPENVKKELDGIENKEREELTSKISMPHEEQSQTKTTSPEIEEQNIKDKVISESTSETPDKKDNVGDQLIAEDGVKPEGKEKDECVILDSTTKEPVFHESKHSSPVTDDSAVVISKEEIRKGSTENVAEKIESHDKDEDKPKAISPKLKDSPEDGIILEHFDEKDEPKPKCETELEKTHQQGSESEPTVDGKTPATTDIMKDVSPPHSETKLSDSASEKQSLNEIEDNSHKDVDTKPLSTPVQQMESTAELQERKSSDVSLKNETETIPQSQLEHMDKADSQERKHSTVSLDDDPLAISHPQTEQHSEAELQERKPSTASLKDEHVSTVTQPHTESEEKDALDIKSENIRKSSIEKVESDDSFLTRKFSVTHSEKEVDAEKSASSPNTDVKEKSPDSFSSGETTTTVTTEKESLQGITNKDRKDSIQEKKLELVDKEDISSAEKQERVDKSSRKSSTQITDHKLHNDLDKLEDQILMDNKHDIASEDVEEGDKDLLTEKETSPEKQHTTDIPPKASDLSVEGKKVEDTMVKETQKTLSKSTDQKMEEEKTAEHDSTKPDPKEEITEKKKPADSEEEAISKKSSDIESSKPTLQTQSETVVADVISAKATSETVDILPAHKSPTEIKRDSETDDEKTDHPKQKPSSPIEKQAVERTIDKPILSEEVQTLEHKDNKYVAFSTEEGEEPKDINLNNETKSKDKPKDDFNEKAQNYTKSVQGVEPNEGVSHEVEKTEVIEKQDHETAETEKGSVSKKVEVEKADESKKSGEKREQKTLPLSNIQDFLEQEKIHSHKEIISLQSTPTKISELKEVVTQNIPDPIKSIDKHETSIDTPQDLHEKETISESTQDSKSVLQEEDEIKPEESHEKVSQEGHGIKTEQIKIDLTDKPEHAEQVLLKSTPDSPIINFVPPLPVLPTDIDKAELGRKSPKEREEDVAKIVASVATVLKSDAPLEEFHKQLPLYTTELRETHITTCDSPVAEKDIQIELIEKDDSGKDESSILKELESNIIVDTKKESEDSSKPEDFEDSGTVHRMLVTASSEDGGEEIEICPAGTITFSRSSESSGRSSPENLSRKLSQTSSILDTISDQTTVKEQTEGQSKKEPVVEEVIKASKDTLEGAVQSVKDHVTPPIYPDLKSLEDQIEEVTKTDKKESKATEEKQESNQEKHSEIQDILSEAIRDVSRDTEDIKDTVSGKIGSVFGSIFSGASKVSEALSHTITDSVKAVESSIDEGLKKVESEIDEVKHKIEDVESKVVDTLVEKKEKAEHIVADQVRESVSVLHDTIDKTDKAKDSLVKQTEDTLDKMAAPLRETLGDALSNLADSLKNKEEIPATEQKDNESPIERTSTNIEDATTDEIEKWIESSGGEVTKPIYPSLKDDLKEHPEISLPKTGRHDTSGELEEKDTSIASVISDAMKDIEETLGEIEDKTKQSAENLTEKISNEIDTEKPIKVLSEMKDEIIKEKKELENTIDDKFTSIVKETEQTISDHKDDISQSIEATKADLTEKLDETKSQIEEGISKLGKSMKEVDKAINEAKEIVKEKVEEYKNGLQNGLSELNGTIDDNEKQLKESMEDHKDAIQKGVSEIDKCFKEKSHEGHEKIKELEEKICEKVETSINNLDNKLEESLNAVKDSTIDVSTSLTEKADNLIGDVGAALDSKAKELGEDVEKSKDSLQDEICEIGKSVTKQCDEKMNAIQEGFNAFTNNAECVSERLEDDVVGKIDDSKILLQKSMESSADKAKEGIDTSLNVAKTVIDDTSCPISDATGTLKELSKKANETSEALKESAKNIAQESGTSLDTVKKDLQQDGETLKEHIDSAVRNVIDDVKSSTDSISGSISQFIEQVVSPTPSCTKPEKEETSEPDPDKETLLNKLETKAENIISSYTDEIKETLKETCNAEDQHEELSFESIKHDIEAKDLTKDDKVNQSVISDISTIVKEELDSSLQGLVGVEKSLAEDINKASSEIVESLKSAVDSGHSLKEDAQSKVKDVGTAITAKSEELLEKGKQEIEQKVTNLKEDVEGTKTAVLEKAESVSKDIKDVKDQIEEAFTDTKETIEAGIGNIKQDLEKEKEAIVHAGKEIETEVKHAVEDVFDAGKKLFGGLFGSKKSKEESKTKEEQKISTTTKPSTEEASKHKESAVAPELSECSNIGQVVGKRASVDENKCDLMETLGLGKSGDISETCDISKGDVQTHLGLAVSQEKKLSISDVEIFVDEKDKDSSAQGDSKTADKDKSEKEITRGQDDKPHIKPEDSVITSRSSHDSEIEKHITDVPSKGLPSEEDKQKVASAMETQKQIADDRVDDLATQLHHRVSEQMDPMMMSFYGALPDDDRDDILDDDDLSGRSEVPSTHLQETQLDGKKSGQQSGVKPFQDPMTSSFYGSLPVDKDDKDPIEGWGKPLGLPSPAPPNEKGTPKKERKVPSNVMAKNRINDDRGRSESPSKNKKKVNPVYVDLTYVPHHGNSNYAYVDFFKRVRARYYVFSGIEPSREVYNALLEAKQTWEDKDLEVTIIPTYDTDVLGYWVAENEELLTKYKIDLSPSASRCTINLQDHETSCSAYRLEF